MSRGPSSFTQASVTRALKAALKAGASVERVKFTREGFDLVLKTANTNIRDSDANEWDVAPAGIRGARP
jgi:hypothetical protein